MTQPEIWLRYTGGAAAFLVLAVLLSGIRRGLSRPTGRSTGAGASLLRSRIFYIVLSALFFGSCYILWRPIPLDLPAPVRTIALILGAILYFPGLMLVLWGRLALGKFYNVSSSLGAQLYADHQLVTAGPFSRVRHPMYLGLILAALGGLLLYLTWTTFFLAIVSPGLILRARREETALQAEFGERWAAYRDQVPGWVPRRARPEGHGGF
jgi:protein-S-isoprenylcysteine O-methyltransferase Ste14